MENIREREKGSGNGHENERGLPAISSGIESIGVETETT